MSLPRLDANRTVLLVADLQERLLPVISGKSTIIRRASLLIDCFHRFDLPVISTEQYRKGLGNTVPELRRRLERAKVICEKLQFSAYVPEVKEALDEIKPTCVLVCGIETHIGILQTCQDLTAAGYTTAVCTDAVGSRRTTDHHAAIERMMAGGILMTTAESALMELVVEAGNQRFRDLLGLMG